MRMDNLDHKVIPNFVLFPFIKELVDEGKDVTIVVQGNSMNPILLDKRDKVTISSCAVSSLKIGDVVVAIQDAPKRYLLHRIVKIDKENVYLMGDGNAVTYTETCPKTTIIGKVRVIHRKGRNYQTNGKHWRIYSWLWMHTLWMRRIFLAIYHRIPHGKNKK